MQPDRWLQIDEIFQAAADCPPASRTALLDSACGADAQLRREVESLLAIHESGGPTTPSAFEDGLKALEHHERINEGRRIGAYLVMREIGRGGMGTVYLAARADDSFQKLVAIKIIRRGLDTDDIIQRFRSERQILATLDHPNVTRLLDGGTTDDGLPFFVMEYIEGQPIDVYCEQRKLNITERLKIFQGVCSAVSYAHQNLVIHRDIKPANVLVTKEGVPRLLDFGIAKLLAPGTSPGERTLTVLRPLTPEYASPEQIRGETITTASDVYSLGVLLYELLTGRRPYLLADQTPAEMERVVCGEEPTRPSMAGGSMPGRRLRGDLDNIVLMAMRREPQRRYGSVVQFSEDIRRHLDGLPVIARPDTFRYRTTKFVARHKAGVAAAVLLVLSLSAGIVATAWQARVAHRETVKAQRINTFLQNMLGFANPGWVSPNLTKNPDAKISEAVDLAASRVESELASEPEIRAEVQRTIGEVYFGLGRWDPAERMHRAALQTQSALYGPNHPETARTSADLAMVLMEKGQFRESEALYRAALSTFRKEADVPSEVKVMGYLGTLLGRKGDMKHAEGFLREALPLASQLSGNDRVMIALGNGELATVLYNRGHLNEAEDLWRTAIAEFRKLPGNYVEMSASLSNLGYLLLKKGRLAEAEPLIREGVEVHKKLAGYLNSTTADFIGQLAELLYAKRDYKGAERAAQEALQIYAQTLPKGSLGFARPHWMLGLVMNKTGRSHEGEAHLRQALQIRTGLLPPGHQLIANAEGALGECLTTQKRFAEAEPLLLQSYAAMKSNVGEQDPRTVDARQRIRTLYEGWHKPERAASY